MSHTALLFLLLLSCALSLPVSAQQSDLSGYPLRLGLYVDGEGEWEKRSTPIFPGSFGCGLFERVTGRTLRIGVDLLLPVGISSISRPGLGVMVGLLERSAMANAEEPYTISVLEDGVRRIERLPHSFHAESSGFGLAADLFWEWGVATSFLVRGGVGFQTTFSSATVQQERLDHAIYRFPGGERLRDMEAGDDLFAPWSTGPFAMMSWIGGDVDRLTIEPGLQVRLRFNPDDFSLPPAVAIGLRLAVRLPVSKRPEPLPPLSATIELYREGVSELSDTGAGLQIEVLDFYHAEKIDPERTIFGPVIGVRPRWEGVIGGVESWRVWLKRGEEVLQEYRTDRKSTPEKLDWRVPSSVGVDTLMTLQGDLVISDSAGRTAEATTEVSLRLRRLVVLNVEEERESFWLLPSFKDAGRSEKLVLQNIVRTIAGKGDTIVAILPTRSVEGESVKREDFLRMLRWGIEAEGARPVLVTVRSDSVRSDLFDRYDRLVESAGESPILLIHRKEP